MTNLTNYGICVGRLTDDVRLFNNSDGSQNARLTVACSNNYKDAEGNATAEFLPLRAFIPADKTDANVYQRMHKGDLCMFSYTVKNNNYEKDGKTVYEIVLQIDSVKLLEGKSVTDARLAARAAENDK